MNLEQLVLASSTVDGVFKIDRKDPVCAFTVDINIAPDDKATPAFGDRFAFRNSVQYVKLTTKCGRQFDIL